MSETNPTEENGLKRKLSSRHNENLDSNLLDLEFIQLLRYFYTLEREVNRMRVITHNLVLASARPLLLCKQWITSRRTNLTYKKTWQAIKGCIRQLPPNTWGIVRWRRFLETVRRCRWVLLDPYVGRGLVDIWSNITLLTSTPTVISAVIRIPHPNFGRKGTILSYLAFTMRS